MEYDQPMTADDGSSDGVIEGPDGWVLTAEGGAFHPEASTAVVADVHLGYEWARADGGDMVPSHTLAETVAKLGRLLGRGSIDRLVVAGDLTETARYCPKTSRDVALLRGWLADRGVDLVHLAGNHDAPRKPPLPASLEVNGWTIAHGHRPIPGDRRIFGHHHPVLRGAGLTAPCFLVDDRTIALPAFSANAAGLDVASAPIPECLRDAASIRCVAGVGGTLLDFGPLARLRTRSVMSP